MDGKNYHNIEKYLSELRAKNFFCCFLKHDTESTNYKENIDRKGREKKKRKRDQDRGSVNTS